MAAFCQGPEPASMDGTLAAVDPFENLEVEFQQWPETASSQFK
jgi:hypothetical protein